MINYLSNMPYEIFLDLVKFSFVFFVSFGFVTFLILMVVYYIMSDGNVSNPSDETTIE